MWALASGSVGPSAFARGALESRCDSEGPTRSPALNDWRRPLQPGYRQCSRVSLALRLRVPNHRGWQHQATWEGSLNSDLGLGLAPRMLADPICWVCGERRGGPS